MVEKHAGSMPTLVPCFGVEISLSASEPGGTCLIFSLTCHHLLLFIGMLLLSFFILFKTELQ